MRELSQRAIRHEEFHYYFKCKLEVFQINISKVKQLTNQHFHKFLITVCIRLKFPNCLTITSPPPSSIIVNANKCSPDPPSDEGHSIQFKKLIALFNLVDL